MTDEIAPEAKTKPYHPAPTLRFPECGVCRRACSFEGEVFEFQVQLPPIIPGVGATTSHGKFIDALTKRRLVGATVCVHGTTLSVTKDRDTLSLLIQLLSERDQQDLTWARIVVNCATAALERISTEGG